MSKNSISYNLNALKTVLNSILLILRNRGDVTVAADANLGDVPTLIDGLSNKSYVSVKALTEIAKCGELLTRFAVFSDAHVASPVSNAGYATAPGNVNGAAAISRYASEASAGNLDFVVFCGDSYDLDNGSDAEYTGIGPIFDSWRATLGNTPLFMIPGNHDFGSDSNWDIVSKMSNYDNLVTYLEGSNRTCYYKVINGDLYIWFAIFNSKSFSYTTTLYNWLFNLLDSNKDKTRIFLFTHYYDGSVDNYGWRFLNGSYFNNGWSSASSDVNFGRIKSYKNLVWISGHSHTAWLFEDTYPTIKVHSNDTARLVSSPSMRDNNQDMRVSVYSNMIVVEPYSANTKLSSKIYFIGNGVTEEVLHVNYTLTGFTSSSAAASVIKNGTYSTLLTLQNSYENPNVLVYMGGVNITSTALTNNQNGTYTVNIAAVTGDIDITATATSSIVTYPITYSLTGYSTSSSNEVVEGLGFTIVLTPNNGYNPTPTSISMTIATLGQVITNGVSGQLGVTISTTDGVTTITCTPAVAVGNVSLSATAPQILDMSYSLASGYTLNNQPSTITAGSSFTTTVTPPSGKTPIISVTMGGIDITGTCVSGNTITIAAVTGNVSITVTETQSAYTVSYSIAPVFTLSNNVTSVNSGTSYTTTITSQSGAMLSAVITMGGVDITSSCLSDNVITINSVTGNISITLTDVSATYADYAKAVYNVTDTVNPTQLLYTTYTLSYILAMVIDGVSVTPALSHQFTTTGMHTVYIKMTDNKTHTGMFQGCTSLYSCTLPAVTAALSGTLFKGCSALHDVELNCNVSILPTTYVFFECPALTTVKLGPNISGLSQYNFDATCTSLSALYIHYPTTFSYNAAASHSQAGTIHYVNGANISTLTAKFPNFTLIADL